MRISLLLLGLGLTSAFITAPKSAIRQTQLQASAVSRSTFLATIGLTVGAGIANADVYSGTSLPQGVQQFSKVLRTRKNLKKVKKRVTEGAAEIDKNEWENISKFLRDVYATGEDMKYLAKSIANANSKQRALNSIDELQKLAQAGDIPVSKQDGSGYLLVADRMESAMDEFFSALTDVPEEL